MNEKSLNEEEVVGSLKHNKVSYNGVMYYLNKGYYRNGKSKPLHNAVYEYETGETIPEGYVIHHLDHDSTNNSILNLQLLTVQEHREYHKRVSSTWIGSDLQREQLRKAQEMAWKRELTAEDIANKSKAGRMSWEKRKGIETTCYECHKEILVYMPRVRYFCSSKCKMRTRRREEKEKLKKQ